MLQGKAPDISADTAGQAGGRRWDLLLAVVLWTPLAIVFVWTLDRVPLHYDEYRTLYVVRGSLPNLFANRLSNGHQPLYFISAWLVARLFGDDSVWSLRTLPLAACFGTLGFLYATARRLAGRYAAVLAVTLCLLSGPFMWACHNARPAAFLAVFVMAATYFIVSVHQKPNARQMILIAAMTLLALLSYNAAIPVVLVMMVGVLFTGPARLRLLAPLLAAALIFAPWFLYTTRWYDIADPLDWLPPAELIHWPASIFGFTYTGDFLATARKNVWWALPAVGLIWTAHIALVVYGHSRIKRFGTLLGLMWCGQLGYGLYSMLVLDTDPMRLERYFVATAMFQAIGLAIAITRLPVPKRWSTPLRVAVGVAVLALAGLGFTKKLNAPAPLYDMDLVHHAREIAPNAPVAYVLQNPTLRLQMDYFLDSEVYLLARVYGLEPSENTTQLGTEPIDVGRPMSPMPHQSADELLIIVHREELEPEPALNYLPATEAMRARIDELIADYDTAQVTELPSGWVYHLKR